MQSFVRRSRARRLAALAWVLVAAFEAPALAQSCAPLAPGEPVLTQPEAQARLTFLASELEAESERAQLWSGLWRSGYTAIAAAQMAVTPFQVREDRLESYVNTGSSLVGVLALTLSPLDVIEHGKGLRARAVRMAKERGVCAALATVQDTLAADAADEQQNKGWVTHVGNVAFNLAIGAVLAFAMHDKTSGAINVVAGTAVGEVMMATQPDRLRRVLQDRRGGLPETLKTTGIRLVPAAQGTGLGLALQF